MKKALSYAAVFLLGSLLSGGVTMAATTMVQAQKGTSVIELNGSSISTPPKLVYGGTTYVQLYSIQQGLKTVFGTQPTWDGTHFDIITPSTTPTVPPTTPPATGTIGVSQLPYTYKSPNGMQITFNTITANSSGISINVTIKNGGNVDSDSSYMSTSNIDANGTQIPYISQDQSLYNNFDQLHPGESVTGNVYYGAPPTGATKFTLYYELVEYINFDRQHITFDLSK